MESSQSDPGQVISRYLAGQLSADECADFERSVFERSSLREEIERTLKLKEGLARLRGRGELDSLIQRSPSRRWLPYATAAALTLAAFGIAWRFAPFKTPELYLAASPAAFATQHEAPQVVASYVLARLRGGGQIAALKASSSGLVRLRILPSDSHPGDAYRAQIKQLAAAGSGTVIGQIDSAPVASDGYVDVYLNSSLFPAADYEISLTSVGAPAAVADPERFLIRLQ
jgi:hypothetical protein